jgi:4-hydroxy-tetrahydrodipicolinate reductase
MTTQILVTGAKGRMGITILDCAKQDASLQVVAGIDQGDKIEDYLKKGMAVIDFSHHSVTASFARIAKERGAAMVIGTTGHSDPERKEIEDLSKAIPIVFTPNMSVGVNLLFSLTQTVASVLKKGYDIEIIEKHHRHKKDAPSGTAVQLLKILANSKGKPTIELAKHGREGDTGERTENEIGVHAIRGGDYVGEHTVIFAGKGEVIEVTHKASSREIFARGALEASKWAAKAKPGLYDMLDVLGLKN